MTPDDIDLKSWTNGPITIASHTKQMNFGGTLYIDLNKYL